VSAAVPVLAGAAVGLAELAFTLLGRAAEPSVSLPRRLVWPLCVGVGGIVVSALVLLAANPHVGRSVGITILGTTAGVGAVALLARVWRR
jgi:hypothetical protein